LALPAQADPDRAQRARRRSPPRGRASARAPGGGAARGAAGREHRVGGHLRPLPARNDAGRALLRRRAARAAPLLCRRPYLITRLFLLIALPAVFVTVTSPVFALEGMVIVSLDAETTLN